MAACILALVAVLAFAAWIWTKHVPPLTNDQIQQLIAERDLAMLIGDTPRANEILRDLHREGVEVLDVLGATYWERY